MRNNVKSLNIFKLSLGVSVLTTNFVSKKLIKKECYETGKETLWKTQRMEKETITISSGVH